MSWIVWFLTILCNVYIACGETARLLSKPKYEIRGPSDSVGWEMGGGLGEEIIGMVVDCGDILEEQPLLVRTISFLIRAY